MRELVLKIKDRRILTYGFNAESDFVIKNLCYSDEMAHFDVYSKQKKSTLTLELPMYGDHNVSNATAAVSIAQYLNINSLSIINGLKNFKGVKRRFTKVCTWRGIDIIDDYAHHPVEIKAVLSAARQYSLGRVIAVHQPHRYSRLNSLMAEFCSCFYEADIVGIMPVYAAGELPITGATADELVSRLNYENDKAKYVKDEFGLRDFVREHGREGDILVCLGAGSISQWVNSLPKLLSEENLDD